MAARVTILSGPARSGKTERLLALYRTALRKQSLSSASPGSTLWLAPTHRSAAEVLGRLPGAELPACFTPGVMTFENFARSLLLASGEDFQPLTLLKKRQLLRFLIEQERAAGRLRHFGPIAHTHGLIDLVSGFITELKRLEIWPEHFRQACEARGSSDKDRELMAIYEAYQQRLLRHRLYDAEGRFWWARDLLTRGQRRPWERLRLVVVDGFTDFTRTQHEILAVLRDCCETMYITLPWEAEPRREELFAKAARTLGELRERCGRLVEEHLPRRADDRSTLAHVEAQLFRSSRQATACESVDQIEILEAARELGEVEQIGRRIKKLLTEGCDASGQHPVPPGEIAVVFRSLRDAAPLLREAFTELGVPFAIETQPPLDESPLAAAVVALLKLVVEDWPFRQLLAVLSSNYMQPNWREWREGSAAPAAERAVRGLQVPSGAAALLEALARRSERLGRMLADSPPAEDDRRRARTERDVRDVQTALALLGRLEKSLQKLPQRATQAQWTEALCALADEIGMVKAIGHGDAELVQRDQAAWDALLEALRDGAELFTQLGEQMPLLASSEFLDLVIDLLGWQRVTSAKEEVGRVRVLSANSVRALNVPYLFFAGLSEKAFPAPERHDRLYSEGECRRLREERLPFPLCDERNQDEMLLFYEVVTRATRQLFLSYPGLNEKAEPLLPSPYLREVERACGNRIPHTRTLELGPVPSQGDLQSQRDVRIHAVHRALDGDLDLLAGLPTNGAGGLRQSVLDGISLVAHRAGREFGRFDGVFADPAAQAALARSFGPPRRWTASHLEQYASCPHRFFLEKVLGLEALDELALETDHLERGSLLHELLYQLHQRLNEELGAPTSPAECNPRQFEDELAAVAQRVLQTGAEHPVQAALREIERRLLLQWAADYRRQHEQYDQRSVGFEHPLRPAHFEVSFGLKPPSLDPLSTLTPLELSHADESVLLGGRIDRIDVGQRGEQAVFNIIDYKSGRPRGDRDQDPDGTQMQLELYALAVEQLLLAERGIKPLAAGYWYVRSEGYRLWQEFHEATAEGLAPHAAWAERKDRILERLFALVRGIRRGEFPMFSVDERCTSYCPFKTVCRVNHARALEKTWQPEKRRAESGEGRAKRK